MDAIFRLSQLSFKYMCILSFLSIFLIIYDNITLYIYTVILFLFFCVCIIKLCIHYIYIYVYVSFIFHVLHIKL